MKKRLMIIGAIFLILITILVITLPTILKLVGFHPDYERVEYDLQGKRALVITTSHDTLGDSGKAVAAER